MVAFSLSWKIYDFSLLVGGGSYGLNNRGLFNVATLCVSCIIVDTILSWCIYVSYLLWWFYDVYLLILSTCQCTAGYMSMIIQALSQLVRLMTDPSTGDWCVFLYFLASWLQCRKYWCDAEVVLQLPPNVLKFSRVKISLSGGDMQRLCLISAQLFELKLLISLRKVIISGTQLWRIVCLLECLPEAIHRWYKRSCSRTIVSSAQLRLFSSHSNLQPPASWGEEDEDVGSYW